MSSILALLARRIEAHEHHGDRIPEGEVISPDPIVSWHHHMIQRFCQEEGGLKDLSKRRPDASFTAPIACDFIPRGGVRNLVLIISL